jgi:peptide-methionine (S)-S-oxide reductase
MRFGAINYLLMPLFVSGLLIVGCSSGNGQSATQEKETTFAQLPVPKPGEAIATFAGGCFWATEEALSELKGVREAVSGYAGGTVKNPTYEQVGAGQTGHAESVQVYYDPKIISFDVLCDAFFAAHNPTTLNRQGPDVGTEYRSVAFYRTPAEKKAIEAAIARQRQSGSYTVPIVTQVAPITAFYPAEKYHQNYVPQFPNQSYIRQVSIPKIKHLRETMPNRIKPNVASL